MKLNNLKLELIQRILATDDPELLESMLEMLLEENQMVKDSQTPYGTQEERPIGLEDLSPEFQESIRRGLADSEAGRVHSHEDEEKYWDQWFKEN